MPHYQTRHLTARDEAFLAKLRADRRYAPLAARFDARRPPKAKAPEPTTPVRAVEHEDHPAPESRSAPQVQKPTPKKGA